MEGTELRDRLNGLVKRIYRTRVLASPQLRDAKDADDYSRLLQENFREIGRLAGENRGVLEGDLFPLLRSREPLAPETVDALREFCRLLLNPWSEEDLDLSLLYWASRRLLEDAEAKGEDNGIVRQLYVHINACYANVNRCGRVKVSRELSQFYRDDGLEAARRMLGYLDRDRFAALDEECKRYVLIHSRFYLALYDTFYVTGEENVERIGGLWRSFRLSEDPFYREQAPNYDWNYHRIRCLEHMSQLTERGNEWGFTPEQCHEIARGTRLLSRLWEADRAAGEEILPRVHLDLLRARNAYYNGELPREDYRRRLLELYRTWANGKYDMYSVLANVFLPVEYLSALEGESLSGEDLQTLGELYQRLIHYILHSANSDAFNFLLEYLSAFLERFVEVPGGLTFEEMGLSCLAALHPPTYVHSIQVGRISRCLCEHLIRVCPERLVGVENCRGVAEVLERRESILDHIYHGGLCHDFGKIAMMDTIFVYGRSLFDREFEIIRRHPDMGAWLLERYGSTRPYVDIARGHHRTFDGAGGYPSDFDADTSPDAPLIHIVHVADCLDAATDGVGRSYNRGKDLDQVVEEFRRDSGTRYAPYVVELFRREEVLRDVNYLLKEGRLQVYRDTYRLLREASQ